MRGAAVDGLVVEGLVVTGLGVVGLAIVGLVVAGLVVAGLVIAGLVVTGLVVTGFVVTGFLTSTVAATVLLFSDVATDFLCSVVVVTGFLGSEGATLGFGEVAEAVVVDGAPVGRSEPWLVLATGAWTGSLTAAGLSWGLTGLGLAATGDFDEALGVVGVLGGGTDFGSGLLAAAAAASAALAVAIDEGFFVSTFFAGISAVFVVGVSAFSTTAGFTFSVDDSASCIATALTFSPAAGSILPAAGASTFCARTGSTVSATVGCGTVLTGASTFSAADG